MSDGTRSGVNWIRAKVPPTTSAKRAHRQRLRDPGHTFEQAVPARDQRDHQLLDHVLLADDDPLDLGDRPRRPAWTARPPTRGHRCFGHACPSGVRVADHVIPHGNTGHSIRSLAACGAGPTGLPYLLAPRAKSRAPTVTRATSTPPPRRCSAVAVVAVPRLDRRPRRHALPGMWWDWGDDRDRIPDRGAAGGARTPAEEPPALESTGGASRRCSRRTRRGSASSGSAAGSARTRPAICTRPATRPAGRVVAMMTEGSADDAAARDGSCTPLTTLPEEAVLATTTAMTTTSRSGPRSGRSGRTTGRARRPTSG